MENENEQFEGVQRLLKLKRHEVPPPGYFNQFSCNVIAGIRAEQRRTNADALTRLNDEAPWLMRFWRSLEAKPAFAAAFGATVCAVILGVIVMSEKPPVTREPMGGVPGAAALAANEATTANPISTQPIILAASNSVPTPPVNLFDLVQPGQSLPAGYTPNRN